MTVLVVSNEILPVSTHHGALERLALGWALGLAQNERVVLGTFTHHRDLLVDDESANLRAWIDSPYEIDELAHATDARAVLLHNRPTWVKYLSKPTVVILHNYSTAWRSPYEAYPTDTAELHRTGLLYLGVSLPLLHHVQDELQLPSDVVGHLPPYVDPIFALQPTPPAPQHRRLLFPNRIMTKKGVEATLRALDHCKDPTLAIDFVSNFSPNFEPDREQRALVELINAHPRAALLPPASTPRATAALYGRSAGVITPSTEPEGFGLVPAEALVLGVPTACSSAGGLQELISAGAHAVDVDDPESFARSLEVLAQSERRSTQQRSESWERFSFERSMASLRYHLKRCISLSSEPRQG